jgi:hypothetical protein
VSEFERLYREQVDAVTAFFARRSADPQTVADLTADTFVQEYLGAWRFERDDHGQRAGCAGRGHHAGGHEYRTARDESGRETDQGPGAALRERVPAPPAGPGGGTVHSGGSSGSIIGPGH